MVENDIIEVVKKITHKFWAYPKKTFGTRRIITSKNLKVVAPKKKKKKKQL